MSLTNLRRKNISRPNPYCMDASMQICMQIIWCCLGAVWTLAFTSTGPIVCVAPGRPVWIPIPVSRVRDWSQTLQSFHGFSLPKKKIPWFLRESGKGMIPNHVLESCSFNPECWVDAETKPRGSGPIHTGGGMRCAMWRKQMVPVDVNRGVHTACKQHQRKNILICAFVASRVLCGLGLS